MIASLLLAFICVPGILRFAILGASKRFSALVRPKTKHGLVFSDIVSGFLLKLRYCAYSYSAQNIQSFILVVMRLQTGNTYSRASYRSLSSGVTNIHDQSYLLSFPVCLATCSQARRRQNLLCHHTRHKKIVPKCTIQYDNQWF